MFPILNPPPSSLPIPSSSKPPIHSSFLSPHPCNSFLFCKKPGPLMEQLTLPLVAAVPSLPLTSPPCGSYLTRLWLPRQSGLCPLMGIQLPALAFLSYWAYPLCGSPCPCAFWVFSPSCASAERLSSSCLHYDTYPVAFGLSYPEQEGEGHKHPALHCAGLVEWCLWLHGILRSLCESGKACDISTELNSLLF